MNMLNENELLSGVIITYNRAQHLQKTLQKIFDSPLRAMPLSVLDNQSQDNTKEIVDQFQKKWPALNYYRNKFNIGGNANILRALELSNTAYHWVIGDDDEWDITEKKVSEIKGILEKGEIDILRLGWLVSKDSRGKTLLAEKIITTEHLFFASVSMISATILKRSLVARYLALAYQNISDAYPQLIPIIKGSEELPLKVYTVTQDLMIHTPSQEPGYYCGDLEWYAAWYRSSRFFSNKQLQKKFVSEVTYYMCRFRPYKLNQYFLLFKVLVYYKSFGRSQIQYLMSMLTYGSGMRMYITLLIFINMVSPVWLLKFFRKMIFGKDKKLNIDRSRL